MQGKNIRFLTLLLNLTHLCQPLESRSKGTLPKQHSSLLLNRLVEATKSQNVVSGFWGDGTLPNKSGWGAEAHASHKCYLKVLNSCWDLALLKSYKKIWELELNKRKKEKIRVFWYQIQNKRYWTLNLDAYVFECSNCKQLFEGC